MNISGTILEKNKRNRNFSNNYDLKDSKKKCKEAFNPTINSSSISLTQVPSLEKHIERVIWNRSVTIVLFINYRNEYYCGHKGNF